MPKQDTKEGEEVTERERHIPQIIPRQRRYIPVMQTEQDEDMPADHLEMEDPSW